MTSDLVIRAMQRAELDVLVDWAAGEGWNPGLNDAQIFWETDPNGFVAAELDGDLIGGGSIVSYDGQFGFMGFFIMLPAFRGRGLGTQLWRHRRDLLRSRLRPGAAIGMDGVFAMQGFYARGGFELSHRDLRFEGIGVPATREAGIVEIEEIAFDELERFDVEHFGAPRAEFLAAWIRQPGSSALASVAADGELRGYGVIRPCRQGYKIGPLFARAADDAERLFSALVAFAPGAPIFLDVPENNPAALALAARHELREVFGCARMYLGVAPVLADREIFGVTTFELG